MGFHASFYIGPALRLKKAFRETKDPFNGCSNVTCPKASVHLGTPFCPSCGHPTIEKFTTQQERESDF